MQHVAFFWIPNQPVHKFKCKDKQRRRFGVQSIARHARLARLFWHPRRRLKRKCDEASRVAHSCGQMKPCCSITNEILGTSVISCRTHRRRTSVSEILLSKCKSLAFHSFPFVILSSSVSGMKGDSCIHLFKVALHALFHRIWTSAGLTAMANSWKCIHSGKMTPRLEVICELIFYPFYPTFLQSTHVWRHESWLQLEFALHQQYLRVGCAQWMR